MLAIILVAAFVVMPWQLVAPVLPGSGSATPPAAELPVQDTPAQSAQESAAVTEVQTTPITVVNPPVSKPVQESSAITYTEEFIAALEKAIHDRINVERVRTGLGILEYDEVLAKVAGLHSTDMAKENYFNHSDENGCTSSCRVTNAGYEWRMVGENLFLLKSTNRYSVEDASAIIVAGWMGSEGHRKNVLEKGFTEEGLGVVVFGDSMYATQVFARPQ